MNRSRRRTLATLATAAVAGPSLASGASRRQASGTSSRTRPIVLVHGAWHGGWCWRDVSRLLRERGATVYTPTLTGLGERAHLRVPVPTLETHVADVLGVIDAEELTDLVLVGHSYGGMVVTGVCDRRRSSIAHVVYLDAAIPSDGQSMLTQVPGQTAAQADAARAQFVQLASGSEWLPVFPAAALGIPESSPDLLRWVDRRMTPHPLPSWLEPLRFAHGGAEGMARTYIACTSPPLAGSAMPLHAERVRSGALGPTWRYRELATGHDAMVTAPAAVAELLMEVAG